MTEHASHIRGYLALLAAAVLYGSSMVASRYLLRDVSPLALSHGSALGIAMTMLAGTAVVRPALLRISPEDIWRFAALGIFGFAATGYLINVALQALNVASAMTLFYLFPAMTLLYTWWRGVERVDGAKVAAVACTLIGCALTAGVLHGGLVLDSRGVAAALGAACAFCFVTLFSKSIPRAYSPITFTVYTFTATGLFFSILHPVTGLTSLFPTVERGAGFVGFVLLLCVGPNLLFFYGLQRVTSTAAGVISSFEIVATSILAWAILGETMTWPQAGGAALVVVGVILVELSRRRGIKGPFIA